MEQPSNKKSKFFWTYTIILFTVAVVLILLSLAMTDYKKVNANYESNIQMLQSQNEALNKEKTDHEATIAALEEKNLQMSTELETLRTSSTAYTAAAESVLTAEALYNTNDFNDAKAELDKVDPTILHGKLLEKYTNISNKVTTKLSR